MAKTSKAKTTEAVESQSVVTPVESQTPVVEKKVKRVKKVVEATPSVEVASPLEVASSVKVASVPETAPVVSEEVVHEGETPLTEQSTEFLAKLQQLGVLISSLKNEYRVLEKKWSRELKNAQKLSSKRKKKAGNRSPSGFVKPTRISDELAKFLEKQPGTEMARTEVTRDINKYIRTNSLQDKENGRKINPDKKLATLLKLKQTDELTYFNLQRYMSPHFAKASDKLAVAPVPVPTQEVSV